MNKKPHKPRKSHWEKSLDGLIKEFNKLVALKDKRIKVLEERLEMRKDSSWDDYSID